MSSSENNEEGKTPPELESPKEGDYKSANSEIEGKSQSKASGEEKDRRTSLFPKNADDLSRLKLTSSSDSAIPIRPQRKAPDLPSPKADEAPPSPTPKRTKDETEQVCLFVWLLFVY